MYLLTVAIFQGVLPSVHRGRERLWLLTDWHSEYKGEGEEEEEKGEDSEEGIRKLSIPSAGWLAGCLAARSGEKIAHYSAAAAVLRSPRERQGRAMSGCRIVGGIAKTLYS